MRPDDLTKLGEKIHDLIHENGLHYAIVIYDDGVMITHVCDQVKQVAVHCIQDAIRRNEQEINLN